MKNDAIEVCNASRGIVSLMPTLRCSICNFKPLHPVQMETHRILRDDQPTVHQVIAVCANCHILLHDSDTKGGGR